MIYKLITTVMVLLMVLTCKEEKHHTDLKTKVLSRASNVSLQDTIDPKIPKNYGFEYQLTAEIGSEEGSMDVHYMVKPNAAYYGMVRVISKKDLTQNYISIFDLGREKMLTCRNGPRGKVLRIKPIPVVKNEGTRAISIVRTDTKKLLGYDCQGYKVTTDDGISFLYSTQDAGFAFNKGFGAFSKLSLKDKGIEPSIVEELEKGLWLELRYNGKNTAKMSVKEITKMKFSVDLSDYKIIGSK